MQILFLLNPKTNSLFSHKLSIEKSGLNLLFISAIYYFSQNSMFSYIPLLVLLLSKCFIINYLIDKLTQDSEKIAGFILSINQFFSFY